MKERGIILVADGDTLLCRTIAAALRRNGYRSVTVRDGDEAIEVARRHKPAVIILDFMIPVMDGMQAARALRDSDVTRDVPIVLLSGPNNGELERLSGTDRAWWSARLEKPITMRTLLRAIERVCGAPAGKNTPGSAAIGTVATRAYIRETLGRLEAVRIDLEHDRPQSVRRRGYELGLRHARRLYEDAERLGMAKLAPAARKTVDLLERGRAQDGLKDAELVRLRDAVQAMVRMTIAVSNEAPHDHVSSPVAPRVPWLLLVCDDSDLAIAAARRSRFYGICVNSVSQASVARNIVHRYPFAAIAVAGSFGSASHGLVRELRAAAPRVPIVVVGAAGADAHRALLRAGADRILPSGVEPERLIAVCGEIIHEGQPSIGTVLTVTEDPATLGIVERRLIDLGCNVVSVPTMTSLEETLDVVQPDLLLAELSTSVEDQIAALERLRQQPARQSLPVVAIAAHAAMAHQLVGRKELVDDVVLKRALGDQIRSTVLNLIRRRHNEIGLDVDASTGALGHEAFLALGTRTLAQADARGNRLGLASIEVNAEDLAKRVGSGAADLMLKAIYHRIRDTFDAARTTIGRLDNGCFAMIAEDDDVARLRRRLHACVSAFTPSVGIRVGAVHYDGEASFKQLLAGSMQDAADDLARATGERANATDDSAAGDSPSQPVYIVEDDSTLRMLLTEQLSRAGFVCRGYGNGREALDALLEARGADERPVVLLDLDIPEIDGLSLLTKLRDHHPDRYRALIMTADESEKSEIDGLRAGADDYVVKPVKIPVMVERIRRLMI